MSGLPKVKAIAKVAMGMTAAAPFSPDANRNPGLPSAPGKILSYLGANVTTAAKPADETRAIQKRQDVRAFQEGALSDIFRANTPEERLRVAERAKAEGARYGVGGRFDAVLARAANAPVAKEKSEALLRKFVAQYLGGQSP